MGDRHVGLGKETTWNTRVAPTKYIDAQSESIGMEVEHVDIKTVQSAAIVERCPVGTIVRGGFTMPGDYEALGEILYLMFGSVDTTGTGEYTHTFPASTGLANRPSATVEVKRGTTEAKNYRYGGVKIDGITINQGQGEPCTVEVSMLGASRATGDTPGTASYRTRNIIKPKQWTVSFDGGSTSFCVTDLQVTIQHPLDETRCLGSLALSNEPIDSDALDVQFTCTAIFEDTDETAKFDGATLADVQIVADEAGDASEASLTLNMDKCLLIGADPHFDGRGRILVSFAGAAEFSSTAVPGLQAILVNDQSKADFSA